MKLNPIGVNQIEVEMDENTVFFSYKTPVAVHLSDCTFRKTSKKWSVTTSRHINSWLRSYGVDPDEVAVISQDKLDAMTA